jgi:hypothetical protein
VRVARGKDALRTVFQRDVAWNHAITVRPSRSLLGTTTRKRLGWTKVSIRPKSISATD